MDFEQIKYAIDGTTAIVTLNRPERRNALSGKLLRELNAALLEADEHNAVHCVVLRGAGPHFCAGAEAMPMPGHNGEASNAVRRVPRLNPRRAEKPAGNTASIASGTRS